MRRVECIEARQQLDSVVELRVRDQNGHGIWLPMLGYRGIRSHLPTTALRDVVERAPEEIVEATLPPLAQSLLAPLIARFLSAQQVQDSMPITRQAPSPSVGQPGCPPQTAGQHSMYDYCSDLWSPRRDSSYLRANPTNRQSTKRWTAWQRNAASEVLFDISSMDRTVPRLTPTGSWTARSRHGQTVLH
eukprot:980070-Rhodomonas_salina.1